jgi:hypothetical protein
MQILKHGAVSSNKSKQHRYLGSKKKTATLPHRMEIRSSEVQLGALQVHLQQIHKAQPMQEARPN